jgi:hypothetical protein
MERRTGDWIDFRVPEKELGRVRVLERGVAMDLAAAIEETKVVEVAEQAIFFLFWGWVGGGGVEGTEQSRGLLLL